MNDKPNSKVTDAVFAKLSPRFRSARMARFAREFRIGTETTILDVGGTPFNWKLLQVLPQVTLLNIRRISQNQAGNMRSVIGDGCAVPFGERSFDVVYSNSVIEHLGTHERQQQFAREVERVGASFYVQTPNRWFPIEPHYLTPLVHFFPRRWRHLLLRYGTTWGWMAKPNLAQCRAMVDEILLLDVSALRKLFPTAEIQRERVFGLTKSIIAVSHGSPQ